MLSITPFPREGTETLAAVSIRLVVQPFDNPISPRGVEARWAVRRLAIGELASGFPVNIRLSFMLVWAPGALISPG